MIVAVFSDVHGNLPALQTFVKVTKAVADKYLCLGDVVDYGPWNDECLEMVFSLPGIVLIEGNHEELFRGIASLEKEAPLVQQFYRESTKYYKRRDLIEGLPRAVDLGSYSCRHTIDNLRIYRDTKIEPTRNHIIGHTHQQYIIKRSGRFIVNPGSVGQNRGEIDMINYALFDTSSEKVIMCKEVYPFDAFVKALYERSYPQQCIDYYLNKPRGQKNASSDELMAG